MGPDGGVEPGEGAAMTDEWQVRMGQTPVAPRIVDRPPDTP